MEEFIHSLFNRIDRVTKEKDTAVEVGQRRLDRNVELQERLQETQVTIYNNLTRLEAMEAQNLDLSQQIDLLTFANAL